LLFWSYQQQENDAWKLKNVQIYNLDEKYRHSSCLIRQAMGWHDPAQMQLIWGVII